MSDKRGCTLWFTGLSGAGKSTICDAVAAELKARGVALEVLDGDVVRTNLTKGLGFSKEDRDINVRRIGFVAGLLSKHGVAVLVAAISPYRAIRQEVRERMPERFVEVHVSAPLEACEARDVKGLYKKARTGEIPTFTGVSDPYEPPTNPEVTCPTHEESLEASVARVLRYLEESGRIPRL